MNTKLLTPTLGRDLFNYVNKVSINYKAVVNDVIENVSNITADYKVRKIKEKDEQVVKELIKGILLEKGGIGVESLYYDKELSELYEYYTIQGRSFHVLTYKKEIIGTIAISPCSRSGSDSNICEIKKMYLKREFRGKGQGRYMMQIALENAINEGYDKCVVALEKHNSSMINSCLEYGFSEASPQSSTCTDQYTSILMLELKDKFRS